MATAVHGLGRRGNEQAQALIAAFVIYGISAPDAAAAVLAYRTLQLGLPAIVGTVAFARLRRTLARSADPAA